jgi:hypothetical protein
MQSIKITKLKGNPSNPRVLRDEKFIKLKNSIEAFPDMLQKRPIVAVTDKDGKYMVLGGNMRLKACADLGMKEVPVILADEWTEEQRREFIIKDNVGFGEWDWDQLANEWDAGQLGDWGLDVPFTGHDANSMTEDDLDMTEEFDPIGLSSGMQRVAIIFDGPEEAESWLKAQGLEFKKFNNGWQVNLSTRSIS